MVRKGVVSMPKISVSISEEILEFIDSQWKNRSKAIVSIIQEYKKKKEQEELEKSYEEYEAFCKENNNDWLNEWENSSIKDIGKDLS
jgi:metal-responsive CopG/Arc/MetJ family transcriptional regulator